jgi:hypothetical protein
MAVRISPRHRIGLREISPQHAGRRIDVLRQQAVAVGVFERVAEQVARLFLGANRMAPSSSLLTGAY